MGGLHQAQLLPLGEKIVLTSLREERITNFFISIGMDDAGVIFFISAAESHQNQQRFHGGETVLTSLPAVKTISYFIDGETKMKNTLGERRASVFLVYEHFEKR